MPKVLNNQRLERMESTSDEEESFETLVSRLRRSRRKETRHSEEKVTMLESLLKQQKSEIEDLRKTVSILKSQEFQRKAKYEETSSAPSLTSSEDEETDESESDFDDEGFDTAPHSSYSLSEPNHPFLIDTILETIMKHLPLKSLLTSRLVCRKWNRFSHHYVLSKSDRVILEVHQPWKPSRGHKLEKFLQIMRGSIEACPVNKFVLQNFSSLTDLEPFFRKFGPLIKSLDLNFSPEFNENGGFRRVLFDYAPFIENLRIECCKILEAPHFWEYSELETQQLKLNYLKTLYFGNIRESIHLEKNWLKDFFRMSPNLRKVILQVHFKENGHAFVQSVLEAMLEVVNLEKIKFLFISSLSQENLQILVKLAEKGLQLKTFKFQDICLHDLPHGQEDESISPEAITNFLQTQSESLEVLKIEQRSNRVKRFLFPKKMGALKHLHFISFDSLVCGQLNYAQQFPKLESLTLRGLYRVFPMSKYFSPSVNLTNPLTLTPGENVRKLSLPSGLRDPEVPQLLARMFPNVKELEIRGASNEFLHSLWESWPLLEIVKMVLSHFDGCLDSGLTGISTEDCFRIRNQQNYEQANADELQEACGIMDLKNLKDIQIECRSIWIPSGILTDTSGYLAFAKLRQLKSFKMIEIGVPEHFDLSDKCIKHLHESLPEAEITFQIMDDHGRWRLELDEEEARVNMYETEPLLEDHNKDKVYCYEKLH